MSINPYIVMLDVLGFKNLVNSNPLDKIIEMYQDLIKESKPVRFDTSSGPIILDYTVFSDSIIIWTEPTKDNINYLCYFLSSLIGYSIKKCMPLRFGIAYGECEMDKCKNIFIGKPIIDAHQTESNQQWIGGAFHESCYDAPYFDLMKYLRFAYIYNVPVKNGTKPKTEYAVNWVCSNFFPDWQADLTNIKNAIVRGTETAEKKDKVKWCNTSIFIDCLLKDRIGLQN
jgi:hypothetical protein